MIIRVNDTDIKFPSSLSDITLGQRIDYHNTYGRDLDEQLKEISEMEDGPLKELEYTMFNVDVAYKTFAFFSGIDLVVLQESEMLDSIMQVYNVVNALLVDSIEVESKQQYEWKDQIWVIHEPELKTTSTMQFGEIIDSKQILQDLHEMGRGKWESLIRLCAIYLRKKDERYHRSFAEEDGERVNLMKELPLDIAMAVGFFLSSSMNSFSQLLAFSRHQLQKADET